MKKELKDKALKIFSNLQKENIEDKDYVKAYSKIKYIGKVKNDFVILLKMIKSYYKGEFYIPKLELSMIVGAIIYLAVPIDAVPDVIPVLGFSDDAFVIKYVISKLNNLIERYKKEIMN